MINYFPFPNDINYWSLRDRIQSLMSKKNQFVDQGDPSTASEEGHVKKKRFCENSKKILEFSWNIFFFFGIFRTIFCFLHDPPRMPYLPKLESDTSEVISYEISYEITYEVTSEVWRRMKFRT